MLTDGSCHAPIWLFCFWRLRTEPCNLRYQQDCLPHVGTNKQTHTNFSPPIRQSMSHTYRIALNTRPCLLKPPHHTHPHPSTTHVLSALVPTRFHLLLPSQQSNTLGPPETQLQPAACPQAEASKQGNPAHRSRKTPTKPDQRGHSQI